MWVHMWRSKGETEFAADDNEQVIHRCEPQRGTLSCVQGFRLFFMAAMTTVGEQSQRDFQSKQGSLLHKTRTRRKQVNLYGRFLSDNFWYKKKIILGLIVPILDWLNNVLDLGPASQTQHCPNCGVWNGSSPWFLYLSHSLPIRKHHSFPWSLYTCLQICYYIKYF